MTIFRIIRARCIFAGMKIGLKIGGEIQKVFQIVDKDRKTWMKGKDYVYLIELGIHPDHQRQGHGYNLVKTMLDALPSNIPVYLETESEGNVKFYEKLGFNVVKKITVPIYDLPMWELIYNK